LVAAVFSLAGGAVAVGSWADLRAPVVAGSRGCMIPDCAYLRHGCSSPAAGGCAALGSGADAWRSRSSGRLAIRLGSPVWFAMGGFEVPDLASAWPAVVTPLEQMRFRLW